MRKRISVAILIVLTIVVASVIFSEASQTFSSRPASVVKEIRSDSLSALWINDGAYGQNGESPSVLAINPQTGDVLLRTLPLSGVRSSDGRWQYAVEAVGTTLRLTSIDLMRGAITRIILLPPTYLARGGELFTQLILSNDNRTLAVTAEGDAGIGTRWRTLVYLVNVETGEATQRIDLFYDEAEPHWQPQVQPVFARDGSRLFVVHQRQRQRTPLVTADTFWTTDIAVVNVGERKLERVIAVPDEVQSQGFWSYGVLAPDGRTLYLISSLMPQGDYRFVAFDKDAMQVARVQLVRQDTGGQVFCDSVPALTPDGRFLYGYCPRRITRTSDVIQFLDTQTGLVTKQVNIERTVESPLNEFSPTMLRSPDDKRLYLVYPNSKEIFVLDIARQAIVQHGVLKESSSTSATPIDELVGWLVGSASAKFGSQPAAVLSPDGQRLYLTEVIDFEKGNGIWAVNTASLRLLGHWLTSSDISGIQLSSDGRELYALSFRNHTLYALDALNGQVLRQFDNVLKQPYGFAIE